MNEKQTVFYWNFKKLVISSWLGMTGLLALAAFYVFSVTGEFSPKYFFKFLACSFAGFFLYFLIVVILFKIVINRDSIMAQSFWGWKRRPNWDQIEKVKEFSRLPLFKFLRIDTNDGKSPIWLPFYIKNKDQFRERILEVVPAGNPLREFFENNSLDGKKLSKIQK